MVCRPRCRNQSTHQTHREGGRVMSKSRWFSGRRGRSADINVIDPGLQRSVRRRAMIAFWVTAIPVGLAVCSVVSAHHNMFLAWIIGTLVGFVAGVLVGLAVLVWPVVRVIWHWLPEITLAAGIPVGLNELATVMWPPYAVASFAALLVGVLAYPRTRRAVVSSGWCVISRHRLRVCFSGFLAGNRDGSLPLILLARPTPVGERVWIWLRPGLSLSMLQDRVEQIAVTCWSNEVTVQRASNTYAGFLRFDIKRRNTLTGVVSSPLVEDIPDAPKREITTQVTGDITALDLPDVPETAVTPEPASKAARKPATRPEPAKAPVPAVVGADGTDVSDWL